MTGPLVFSLLSVATTLGGGALVLWKTDWVERRLWRFLAFGSGILLGMTFLHLLPEAWELNPRWAGASVLAAFLLFFLVEEFTVVHPCSEVTGDCHVHSLGGGAFLALFLHSLADGLAIAFAFLASRPLGIAVSGAVAAHKFSDGMTLASLFKSAGYGGPRIRALILGLSLATPLGVVLGGAAQAWNGRVLAAVLGLAAGGFLYVSASDILPRLHKNRDAACWVFLALGAGLSALFPHH